MAELIYGKLCDLLADSREGQDITLQPGMQPTRAVSRTRLRETVDQAGILDPVEDEADRKRIEESNRKRVNRAINRLINQKKAVPNNQWIGLPK